MKPRIIFFVGKPGCGKGTQAKLLADETRWPTFASGDLFRKIASEDTMVGRKVKTEIDSGLLTPHWFAMYLYLNALFSISENSGAIFDGFSRKVHEAELIVESLRWLGWPFTIINIAVSDAEVEKRLEGRREVSGRADDHVVSKRLQQYYKYTEPAIDIFRKSGVFVEINGEQIPEKIADDIRSVLADK